MRVGLHALGIGTGARPLVIRAVAMAAEAEGFAILWSGSTWLASPVPMIGMESPATAFYASG